MDIINPDEPATEIYIYIYSQMYTNHMRLWGACWFVAGILMLVPLQSAVTACDCDFTATISLDDSLASELANETFLYTDLNLSDRESIKNILENSEKIQSILEYFGINEDGLLFNDSLVIMINETDRYVMVPLNLTTGNQWNVTVNVTNEETNETTPWTIVGDFAAISAYLSGGEVINAGWLEIEKIAGGLLYTISDGNRTIDFATSDELGIGITSGGVTVSGVMWDTQDGNVTPPPQPTDEFRDCMKNCLSNIGNTALAIIFSPAGFWIGLGIGASVTLFLLKYVEAHPIKGAAIAFVTGAVMFGGPFVWCWVNCSNGTTPTSVTTDIYISEESVRIAYPYNDDVFSVEVNRDGEVNVEVRQ